MLLPPLLPKKGTPDEVVDFFLVVAVAEEDVGKNDGGLGSEHDSVEEDGEEVEELWVVVEEEEVVEVEEEEGVFVEVLERLLLEELTVESWS